MKTPSPASPIPPALREQLRAETEAARERIWLRAQHWERVLRLERVGSSR
jgi:hypothetical protein